jgi:hypothetical protein
MGGNQHLTKIGKFELTPLVLLIFSSFGFEKLSEILINSPEGAQSINTG